MRSASSGSSSRWWPTTLAEPTQATVVVVTHNSRENLGALAESLNDGLAGLSGRLIVVDNASRDGSPALARQLFPSAEVVQSSENRGFAAGVNIAFERVASEDHVLILNHDVRLSPRCGYELIESLGRSAAGGRTVGIAVPRLLGPRGEPVPSLRREPLVRRAIAETLLGVRIAGRLGIGEAVLKPDAYRRETEADWGTGAALAISAECRSACGPWDESFFLYSEECEYCARARDHAFATRLVPDAVVTHTGTASRTDPTRWTLLVLNKLELYRRRHGLVLGEFFRVAAIARELRFAAAGNAPSRAAARALIGSGSLYGRSYWDCRRLQ